MTTVARASSTLPSATRNHRQEQQQTIFIHQPNGLSSSPSIPLNPKWIHFDQPDIVQAVESTEPPLPTVLTPPSFVQVYDCLGGGRQEHLSLQQLAQAAREVIDQELPRHGAILFRNLQQHITCPIEFKEFWEHVRHAVNKNNDDDDDQVWNNALYVPMAHPRTTIDGVDTATNVPHTLPLPCHNEMNYNPVPPTRIALYCLEPADFGGETLICRNRDVTDAMQPHVLEFVKQHGLIYKREYPDETAPGFEQSQRCISWQKKCQTTDPEQARLFFTNIGFDPELVFFDKDNTLMVQNKPSGFWPSSKNGQSREEWFNIIKDRRTMLFAKPTQSAESQDYPDHICLQVQLDSWRPVKALKLQEGDWLVLDNWAVQHGRLPYEESDTNKRTLLTVYTE